MDLILPLLIQSRRDSFALKWQTTAGINCLTSRYSVSPIIAAGYTEHTSALAESGILRKWKRYQIAIRRRGQ